MPDVAALATATRAGEVLDPAKNALRSRSAHGNRAAAARNSCETDSHPGVDASCQFQNVWSGNRMAWWRDVRHMAKMGSGRLASAASSAVLFLVAPGGDGDDADADGKGDAAVTVSGGG